MEYIAEKHDSWDGSFRRSPRCRNGAVYGIQLGCRMGRGKFRRQGDTGASTHRAAQGSVEVKLDRLLGRIGIGGGDRYELEANLALDLGVSDRAGMVASITELMMVVHSRRLEPHETRSHRTSLPDQVRGTTDVRVAGGSSVVVDVPFRLGRE